MTLETPDPVYLFSAHLVPEMERSSLNPGEEIDYVPEDGTCDFAVRGCYVVTRVSRPVGRERRIWVRLDREKDACLATPRVTSNMDVVTATGVRRAIRPCGQSRCALLSDEDVRTHSKGVFVVPRDRGSQ